MPGPGVSTQPIRISLHEPIRPADLLPPCKIGTVSLAHSSNPGSEALHSPAGDWDLQRD